MSTIAGQSAWFNERESLPKALLRACCTQEAARLTRECVDGASFNGKVAAKGVQMARMYTRGRRCQRCSM